MAIWILKAMIQRGLDVLPARAVWNEVFRTYVTRSLVVSPSAFEDKLDHCRRHLSSARAHGMLRKDFSVFDLGTGWLPVLPVGMYLSGAKEVYTCDISPLLKPSRVRFVLNQVVEYADRGLLEKHVPTLVPERVERVREVLRDATLRTSAELLKPLDIHVLIGDAGQTKLPAGTVDLFVSTVVLEYIPPTALVGIFKHFLQLATPEAVMSHCFDMSDQYASFDRSITPFNFLQFSSKQWSWINNSTIPLTRLRMSDYRRLVEDSGWTIAEESNTLGKEEDLDRVPLAAEFQRYSREDLLVLRSWLVAKR